MASVVVPVSEPELSGKAPGLVGAMGQSIDSLGKIVINVDPMEWLSKWVEDPQHRPVGKVVAITRHDRTMTLRLRPWDESDHTTVTMPYEVYSPDWQTVRTNV